MESQMRLAAETWSKTMDDVVELFTGYGVLQYIEECFGTFARIRIKTS